MRAAAVHSLVLHDNPAVQADLTPIFDDKTEAVRLRAAAGYLRLDTIKNTPKPEPKKPRRGTGKKPAAVAKPKE